LGGVLAVAGFRAQAALAAYQHYDYLNSVLYEWGGQNISGGLFLRRQLRSKARLDSGLHP